MAADLLKIGAAVRLEAVVWNAWEAALLDDKAGPLPSPASDTTSTRVTPGRDD